MRSALKAGYTVVAALLLVLGTVAPAWAEVMTLTFVRHAQSEANAANVLDTKVPGPNITAIGVQQALDLATRLGGGAYDGVYASTMVRSQQTAAPLATALGEPVVVLDGIQEISGGVFEGQAERGVFTLLGYGGPPLDWTFGLRSVPIIGSSDTGNGFDERVDGAIRDIYDTGDRTPVIVAHGGTIMFWVMMNVDNPDPFLILTHPLDNTQEVVVTGDPDVGWTLTNWGGTAVDPNPSLLTRVFVAVRDIVAALQGGNRASPAPAGVTAQPVSELVAQDDSGQSPEPSIRRLPTPVSEASPATDDDEQEAAAQARTTETPKATGNGATDLSDGNKATPGVTHADAVETDDTTEPTESEQTATEDAPAAEPAPAGVESAPEPAADGDDSEGTPAAA